MDINKLLELFNNDVINWKEHADASIPDFDDEKINVYEFNEDDEEPLRPKYVNAEIIEDTLVVDYICQEDFDSTYGMEKEIERFLKAVNANLIHVIFNITSNEYGARDVLEFNKDAAEMFDIGEKKLDSTKKKFLAKIEKDVSIEFMLGMLENMLFDGPDEGEEEEYLLRNGLDPEYDYSAYFLLNEHLKEYISEIVEIKDKYYN